MIGVNEDGLAIIVRERQNLFGLPWVKKNLLYFSNVTASVSRYPRRANFCGAREEFVESSIMIVDDDDSVTLAGNLALHYFKFMLSIM